MEYGEFTEKRSAFELCAAELTTAWKSTGKPVKAKFPRGYIRTYASLRPRWPYLGKDAQSLVAQMVQLSDVNRWNLHIWDLAGTAGAAYVWRSTIPLIAVIEVLCREYVKLKSLSLRTKKKSFENFIWAVHDAGVVDSALCDKLHDLRRYRNTIHLNPDQTPQIAGNGMPEEWNRACSALQELETVFRANP